MSKKILMISPTPSHPQNAGNKARIYNLLLALKEEGYDVYFAHIQETPGDELAMQQCWQDKFYSIPYRRPKTAYKKPLKSRKQEFIRKLKSLVASDPQYTYAIDDWYDPSLDEKLIHLSQAIEPDIVLVEYVFFSKALDCFDKSVLKLIDTHDIFADRYKLYLKNRKKPQWYSTTKKEENKGLKRANIVIAIQKSEAQILSKRLRDKEIVTIGHIVNLQKQTICDRKRDSILFIGSRNPINVYGIEYFLQDVFPKIKGKFADIKFLLAGDICDVIESREDITKLGKIENLNSAYEMADIVINPIRFGTGLKIKNIEALGYSKPLVTTAVGAEGIENGIGHAFLKADSPDRFSQSVIELLVNDELYENISSNAYQFAKNWNQQCLKTLIDILD